MTDGALLAERLSEAGYAVTIERFAARPSAEPWLGSYAALSAAAAVLVYSLPHVAVFLGVAAVVLHARESDGRPLLRTFSTESLTVVARAPTAASPDVIVVAGLSASYRRFGDQVERSLGLCLQALMAAVPAAGAAAWVAEAESELPASVATGGVVAAAAIVGLVLALYRPPPGGALAGNPALGVLVELAPSLREERVWLVAGDELGPLADEMAGAAWLNLAPAPADEVIAVSEEGAWRERRADRGLMGTAEEAGAEVRPYRFSTRATALLARRRRALTLLVPEGPDGVRIAAAVVRGSRG